MKKLKKVFGVFAVALLLMSMSSNTTITKEEVLKESCWDHAVYIADWLYDNGHMDFNQSQDHMLLILAGCTD